MSDEIAIGRAAVLKSPATARGLWPIWPFGLALLALAGCAQPKPSARDNFVAITSDVFTAGYTHIQERYIEPLVMSDVALSGMENTSLIDTQLRVVHEGDYIRVTEDGKPVATFIVPADQAPADWARLTARVIEAGRNASPTLHDAPIERIYQVVFDGALTHLDRFSRYSPAALARLQRGQRDGFGGIGLTVTMENDALQVDSVMEESPAAKSDLQPGDTVLEIDGNPVKSMALADAVERLRGPIGSFVRVKFAHSADEKPREATIFRALIIPATVSYELRGDVAYIRVSGFNQHTASSLERGLRRALREEGDKLRGVILDLRGNPGGLLDQAVTVSDLFLSRGRILSTVGRHPDSSQVFDAAGNDLVHGLPVVLLVDGNTASAAEVVAAALQDEGRAIVVGSASYGKGTVQTVHRLPNDGEIVITWSRIITPSGYVLNEVGVIPNVCTSKVTTNPAEAVMQVVDLVKSGRLETAAARAALHAHPDPDKAEIRALRAVCPPKPDDSPLDLEVARHLIEDGALYARAQERGNSPEIAKSK